MSDPLHPAFDPWFQTRHPAIALDGAHAVLALLADGATPPFIARYRRERTGNLDAAAVRTIAEAKELFDRIGSRQQIILESIARHATLTAELREKILSSFDLDLLEDLYHPYRQQKKNRARDACEAGLEPLADWIWNCGHGSETPQEGQTLELWAFTFRNEEKGIGDAKAAIEGARDILVERLAGDPELRALVRRTYFEQGFVRAARADKAKPHSKFEPYFAFQERVATLREPKGSHRYLALRRGQSEGELQLAVGGAAEDAEFDARLVASFEAGACSVPDSPGAEVLRHAGRIAFKNNVRTSIENEVHRVLKEVADATAAQAFADDVKRLLLEPPLGARPVLGVDPVLRGGCKLAAVDANGSLKAAGLVHLETEEQQAQSREAIVRLARESAVEAVAVANVGAGREAEVFVRRTLRAAELELPVALVDPCGGHGTGEAAQPGLSELEASLRGAISIARRLQDPLAELIKLEPRAIGGQYPHDVTHAALQKAFDAVVEDVVHGVGVNLNAAPGPLLARVAGIGPALAQAIVQHRDKHGPFLSRRQLRETSLLGERAFEQAAGFLRVPSGECPLDETAVHPERYAVLETLAGRLGKSLAELTGPGAQLLREAADLKEQMGPITWEDVIAALEKRGSDPRGTFVPFQFREDVQKLEDLRPGMVCPGLVSNVTGFGAFVDVGVRQDGLVHVSQLGRAFAKEPREVVKPGDRVEVRVLKVDLEKKQISLSMKPAPPRPERRGAGKGRPAARPPRPRPRPTAPPVPPPAEGVAEGSANGRAARPRPGRPSGGRRPGPAAAPERRPEARRPAFNNPFAVLADLKVPSKNGKD